MNSLTDPAARNQLVALTPTAQLLLDEHARWRARADYRSNRTLARRIGRCSRSVQRAHQELTQRGLIVRVGSGRRYPRRQCPVTLVKPLTRQMSPHTVTKQYPDLRSGTRIGRRPRKRTLPQRCVAEWIRKGGDRQRIGALGAIVRRLWADGVPGPWLLEASGYAAASKRGPAWIAWRYGDYAQWRTRQRASYFVAPVEVWERHRAGRSDPAPVDVAIQIADEDVPAAVRASLSQAAVRLPRPTGDHVGGIQ